MTPGFLSLEESNSESEGTHEVIHMNTSPAKSKTHVCEQNYKTMAEESCIEDSNVLLLDEVLIPLEETEVDPFCKNYPVHHSWYKEQVGLARQERDNALILARHYRNKAKETVTEKRAMQHKLEKKVELTRDFWRNKVVEGNSCSGTMLRAALLRNN